MAIQIDEFRLPITVKEARDFLQQQTDDFGVFFDIDRCTELRGILQLQNIQLIRDMRKLCGNSALLVDEKDQIYLALIGMGVEKKMFYINGEYSVSAPVFVAILQNKNYTKEVHEFCKLYQTYTSNKRNAGFLRNVSQLPQSVALSKNGHKMSIGNPKWNILSTSRISASDPGVQGVPRTMTDIICEPYGYTLLRADSGQIEPRINFSYFLRDELIMNLIMAYGDAYFGIMHYCLMKEEEIPKCRENFQKYFRKAEVTDELKATRQNIKRLTNAGSYGSSNLDDVNPALASVYDKRIVHHPARIALEENITESVKRGVETFYGAFGTPVTPDSTERYTKGSSGWHNHLIRCGINNPVQTTASELMLFSIHKAMSVLKHAKDSHVCFYKHDEACFYISDADVKDGILDELKEVTAYNVKGWIPIESDPEIGIKKGAYPSYIS